MPRPGVLPSQEPISLNQVWSFPVLLKKKKKSKTKQTYKQLTQPGPLWDLLPHAAKSAPVLPTTGAPNHYPNSPFTGGVLWREGGAVYGVQPQSPKTQ